MQMTEMQTIVRLMQTKTQVSDFVEDFKRYLSTNHPHLVKPYRDRLKRREAREGAQSEAVVFPFLKSHYGHVQIEEDATGGGADFRCKTADTDFVVEVTCLGSEFVTSQTGLPNEIGPSGPYDMIANRKIHQRASKKANQIRRYNCPAVLILTSMHAYAPAVLNTESASQLLRGEKIIEISHNYLGKTSSIKEVSNQTDSTFFRWKNRRMESCKRSISAILLLIISGANVDVIGIVHPDPYYEFPMNLLPSVPFGRLTDWPSDQDRIHIDWVSHNERIIKSIKPARFWFDEMRNALSNGTS